MKEPDVICAFVTTFGLSSRFHEVRHCAASLYETTLGSNGIRDISNNRRCFFVFFFGKQSQGSGAAGGSCNAP